MHDDVQYVFDSVLPRGHVPQATKVYDEHDNLIHPNDVPGALDGAIIGVTCTVEKLLLKGQRFAGGKQWQFYVNIAKVKILPRQPEPRTNVPTLKRTHPPEML
jgi:hypothetical protein